MTTESKIRLLVCKSFAYKSGFRKAVTKGDTVSAGKWKEGYHIIKERIDELKDELAG